MNFTQSFLEFFSITGRRGTRMSGIQAALEPADGKKTDARNAHIKLRSNYDAKEVFALINMKKQTEEVTTTT